jgi:hypothetical protein
MSESGVADPEVSSRLCQRHPSFGLATLGRIRGKLSLAPERSHQGLCPKVPFAGSQLMLIEPASNLFV